MALEAGSAPTELWKTSGTQALNQDWSWARTGWTNSLLSYLDGKSGGNRIVMHGLFSTDVGLFDPLLRFLRADSGVSTKLHDPRMAAQYVNEH